MSNIQLIYAPIIIPLAEMKLDPVGVELMAEWVKQAAPGCIERSGEGGADLFPHRDPVSDNELLVELCGRKCYNSFGAKAGRKSNQEYIANTQMGDIPHASIMYHAKMSFFIGGVSRRVSHELIRHYVGADRDEEGSPSQESTRYVEHSGRYVLHPRMVGDVDATARFQRSMEVNRECYLTYILRENAEFEQANGKPPTGMDRKRIFECASSYLSHSVETSFIWTTNPVALAKLIRERNNESADLEIRRLAQQWKTLAMGRWPNLFPQWHS